MIKQKWRKWLNAIYDVQGQANLFLLLFSLYAHAKNMFVVWCSMRVHDLLHFRAVDVDTLPDSFLRRYEKRSGIVWS